ncbi:MAG: LegC family aminotransferase [Spirochaetes bacterium]|nr:LegC family aminotransferase [Spirochaetota bacterium]
MNFFEDFIKFIKEIYKKDKVGLHEPVFIGNEKKYLIECIDSTFVSYVGEFVDKFEKITANFTKSKYAIAVVNGTAGLHITLKTIGVEYGDEVITQALTFVAVSNSIAHCGAYPVFIDVDIDTLGMSPESLEEFLVKNTKFDKKEKVLVNKNTKRKVKAVVPVHIFGHPCKIDKIIDIANRFNLPVIEDATEALGSYYKNKHCGTFGIAGVLSYNGNKTVTTGGGGMILTNDDDLAKKLIHVTKTAKVPHPWEYIHDEVGYNYRLPNVNAAIGFAQMEYIDKILNNKRETAKMYEDYIGKYKRNSLNDINQFYVKFVKEPEGCKSNYWLNAILLSNKEERDNFLEFTNKNGVMTRPVWRLMHKLPMYKNCFKVDLKNSEWIEERLVNIPSGYRI